MKNRIALALILVLLVGLAMPVQAQFALGVQILENHGGSAREIGMGGISLSFSEGIAAARNPSGYAFQFRDRYAALNIAPSTDWLTNFATQIELKQNSYGVGYSLSQLKPERVGRFDLAVGLAYTNQKFEYGSVTLTDEGGITIKTVYPEDQITTYTFSVGFQYYLEVGVGFNRKEVNSDFIFGGRPPAMISASTSYSDIAICARLPLHEFLPGMLAVNRESDRPLSFKLTPFISRVESGDHTKYLYESDRVASPLPEFVRDNWGMEIEARLGQAPLLSLVYVDEDQELTVGVTSPVITNADREGTEIGLAGTVYIRSGSYIERDSDLNIDTDGWGVSSRGLVDWLIDRNVIKPRDNWFGSLLDRLEIRYDHAKYSTSSVGLDNTTYNSFSVTF